MTAKQATVGWRRDRHWFAPPLHGMLRAVLPRIGAPGARLAEFAAALPSAATAYLQDHQVCFLAPHACASQIVKKVFRLGRRARQFQTWMA